MGALRVEMVLKLHISEMLKMTGIMCHNIFHPMTEGDFQLEH